ncbi:MAG TPA: IPT/TIG domain-containing protein, partial [Acidimicrobiales bacterium]|nr:IPT/TIG domain-containing protein [Acidimicrobiales bacterium]
SATSAADAYTYDGVPTMGDLTPSAGPEAGGTQVTISGTGFTPETSVTFGTVGATSVSVISPTLLTATSPPGEGTVDVTITTAGGSDPSPVDQFTYCARPSIISISPSSGAATGGVPITITGTGFVDGTTVSFGAEPATAVTVLSPTVLEVMVPAGVVGTVDVVVTTPGGTSARCSADGFTYSAATPAQAKGYWTAASDGGVFAYGDAGYYGSLGGIKLDKPINGMISTGDGKGYWLVASDGGVFAFGDAGFYGSLGGIKLTAPIVGMTLTPDGRGYWMVASDGGVFAFGDAAFYGSLGGKGLHAPVTAMAATPDGRGYWIVSADGGVFAFGDAGYDGSLGGITLTKPINAIASTADGKGYWMVASDGGVFAFGDAAYHGSTGGVRLAEPIVGMAVTPGGAGYWLVASDGGIFAFGDACFYGSMGGRHLDQPMVAMAYPR